MDKFVVYILYSEKFGKNYTGFTSNLIARFNSHNLLETKGYTLKFRPWKVIHVEFFDSKAERKTPENWCRTGLHSKTDCQPIIRRALIRRGGHWFEILIPATKKAS